MPPPLAHWVYLALRKWNCLFLLVYLIDKVRYYFYNCIKIRSFISSKYYRNIPRSLQIILEICIIAIRHITSIIYTFSKCFVMIWYQITFQFMKKSWVSQAQFKMNVRRCRIQAFWLPSSAMASLVAHGTFHPQLKLTIHSCWGRQQRRRREEEEN